MPIGGLEVVVIIAVICLVFPGRVVSLCRSLGESIGIIRRIGQ